jgi:hypothetical protein
MRVLGVHVDDKLNFQYHVSETIKSFAQSLFALKTMKNHGLPLTCLQLVFASVVLGKLTYASPS